MSSGTLIMTKPIALSSSVTFGKIQIATMAKTAIMTTSEFGISVVCKSIIEIASNITVTPNTRIVASSTPNRTNEATAIIEHENSTSGYLTGIFEWHFLQHPLRIAQETIGIKSYNLIGSSHFRQRERLLAKNAPLIGKRDITTLMKLPIHAPTITRNV